MSQIDDLQSRLMAAMERIGSGVAAVTAEASAAAQADAELTQALEDEKTANAQLEERLRTLREKHAAEIEEIKAAIPEPAPAPDPVPAEELEVLQHEISTQADTIASLDQELQRLRTANDQLREANAALRAANEEGVGDADLINQGMVAEIEAMRAARSAELAETGAILAKLEPLLAAARDHLNDPETEVEAEEEV